MDVKGFAVIDQDFLNTMDLIENVEKLYKKKNFSAAVFYLDSSLNEIKISSGNLLSTIFDMTGSVLWKLGNTNDAKNFWIEAIKTDANNRHALLSLRLLFQMEHNSNSQTHINNNQNNLIKSL